MKRKDPIPDSVREQLRRAGKARAKQITTDERKRFGKKAWATRLKNAAP